MISGRKTLRSIESAISEMRGSVRQAQGELKSSTDKKASLLKKRIKAFRELAEFKVKDALYDNVIEDADNLSQKVSSLLHARNKTVVIIKKQLKQSHEERDSILQSQEKVLEDIDACENELDDIAGNVEDELLKMEEYASLRKKLDDLKSKYEKAEIKTKQAEENRDEKGEPYKADILFTYLWKRGYGSLAYKSKTNAIVARLDKWVADLTDFNSNKANFAVLLQIPKRLNDHLERLKKQIGELQHDLDEQRKEKIIEMVGSDLMGKLEDLRKQENDFNIRLHKTDDEIADVTAQITHFSEGKDYSFKKAVEAAADAMEHENFEDLLYEARQTDDSRDDKILERIGNIDSELEDLEDVIEDHKDDLRRLSRREQELVGLAADFRRKHYDDPGSGFSVDSNMNTLIGELVKGAISASEYWATAQRHHRWASRPADPFRYSSPLPPFAGSFQEVDYYDEDILEDFDDDY